MFDTIKPAAQRSYAAYVKHLTRCAECPRPDQRRCPQGGALVQVYLADVRAPDTGPVVWEQTAT